MPDLSIQIKSKDGCTYIFVLPEKHWFKFCPVTELPPDVKDVVGEMENEACRLKGTA